MDGPPLAVLIVSNTVAVSATRAAMWTSKRSPRGDVAGTEQGERAGTAAYTSVSSCAFRFCHFHIFSPHCSFMTCFFGSPPAYAASSVCRSPRRTWLRRSVGTGSFPRTDSRVLATRACVRSPACRTSSVRPRGTRRQRGEKSWLIDFPPAVRSPQVTCSRRQQNWPMKLTGRPHVHVLCVSAQIEAVSCRPSSLWVLPLRSETARQKRKKKRKKGKKSWQTDTQGGDTARVEYNCW